MGALRQPRITEDVGLLRKPPQKAVLTPLEKLRARTDYDKGEGWSALPHAAFVDLLKLSSGEVCLKFIWAVNIALSSGSARSPREAWDSFTDFRSSQEWADSCASNVRDIQRQLSDLAERGMISVKQIKSDGTIKYAVSLLFRKWGTLESYAVWKRKQVIAIDEAPTADEPEDEDLTPISKDAVHLTKKPQTVRPGRASRAVKISVGVREMCFENTSTTVDAVFQGVITSGRLVVSATFRKGESEAKGEVKEKVARHTCREVPANEGSVIPAKKIADHPRAVELAAIFDPLLKKSQARLLSEDSVSLLKACDEYRSLPKDDLLHFLMAGDSPRAARPISSPKHVAAIVREAVGNWVKLGGVADVQLPAKKQGFADGVLADVARRLKRDGKV